jgi:hypothetical protein
LTTVEAGDVVALAPDLCENAKTVLERAVSADRWNRLDSEGLCMVKEVVEAADVGGKAI